MVVVVEVDGSSHVLLKLSKPCGVCLCIANFAGVNVSSRRSRVRAAAGDCLNRGSSGPNLYLHSLVPDMIDG